MITSFRKSPSASPGPSSAAIGAHADPRRGQVRTSRRRYRRRMGSHGIALGPDDGDRVVREARRHRILAELPELEVIELCFGRAFEGVGLHTHDDHVDSFYVLA